MTVGGVGAQADVARHQEAGEVLAQQTDGLDSRGVLGVGCGAPLILAAGEGQRGVSITRSLREARWPAIRAGQPTPSSPPPPLDQEACSHFVQGTRLAHSELQPCFAS